MIINAHEHSMIVPSHTRTIYINYIDRELKANIKKYKLKLPELRFQIFNDYLNVFIYEKNERCVLPFPNILDYYSCVCLGDSDFNVIVENDIEKAVNIFFNTSFTLAHIGNLMRYVRIDAGKCSFLDICEKIDEFYKKWERSGKLELVKF
jgi:hypothetical protein